MLLTLGLFPAHAQEKEAFSYDPAEFPDAKPWTSENFKNNPDNYDYDLLHGNEYITVASAGATFVHDGPGNVDHMTWVTMTEDGPKIANIALKGIFDRKGLDPKDVRRL